MNEPRDKLDRLIDRALREERDGLPENFAARTAALVEAVSREAPSRDANDRLEGWLQRVGIVALGIGGVVSVFAMGRDALASLARVPGAGWVFSIALCVGLSFSMQVFTQRRPKSL
jgi:hypothetical protein